MYYVYTFAALLGMLPDFKTATVLIDSFFFGSTEIFASDKKK